MYKTSPKKPEAVQVANGEILPITHYARLYLKMGKLTICFSLHITKYTGDIILGYLFLTRFEPLIHWKERYMEIKHQGYDYKRFCLPAQSTISEYYPDKSIKPTFQTSVDLLQISQHISLISTRLDNLQTSLTKRSLQSSLNNSNNNKHKNINNNIINNNYNGSYSTLRVLESTATSSMNHLWGTICPNAYLNSGRQ